MRRTWPRALEPPREVLAKLAGDDSGDRPAASKRRKLAAEFYDEIVSHAVPLDLRALRALKGSPMALDIYTWLTYRMSYLRRPSRIPWDALAAQFGAAYGRQRNFRRKFLAHLRDVLHVYPAARMTAGTKGLILKPSPSHIPRASARRD